MTASARNGDESGNDKRFPRGPAREPERSGGPAARKRHLPRRRCSDRPSAARDPTAGRAAVAGFSPAAATAFRSAVLSVPAFPALASHRRSPHRKTPITRFPLQASYARIAPIGGYQATEGAILHEKGHLGACPKAAFRHHFGRSSASQPVPQR